MEKAHYHWAFQQSRMVVFEVSYYTCGNNAHPYFATSAHRFNQPKTDYSICGQAQDELLTGLCRKFWLKWNKHHCKDLSDEECAELMADIEELKERYNYIEKPGDRGICFFEMKKLSMQNVKRQAS